MNKINRLRILTTTAFAIIPATLWAQNALSELDTNDDGAIGRQEAMAAQVESFHRLDADGNGQISLAELEASQAAAESERLPANVRHARAKSRERWLANLDSDDSGAVTLAEYQAAMTPYFDRLDGNDDGVLDGGELRQAVEPNRGRAAK